MARVRRVIVRRLRAGSAISRASEAESRTTGVRIIDNNTIRQFNPSMLELGDICAPCQEKEAVAAVFDLTGFTAFCNQVDSYLAIPKFLNDFLEWFFTSIRRTITEKDLGDRAALWVGLPIMVKFLGDGLILLWDARKMNDEQVCRLAGSLYDICRTYRTEFYPRISMAVNKPPLTLRGGVARGKVYSIGNDREYVGHCINNATRLSRLGTLSFAFPHHGFRVKEFMPDKYHDTFVPKYVSIRGVGQDELVWVVKDEFNRLPEKNRDMFRNREMVRA
jgi:hypothetical protein